MNRHATVAVSIGAISAPCGLLQRERLVVLVVTSVPSDDVGRRRRVKGTFRSHSGGPVEGFIGCNVIHALVVVLMSVQEEVHSVLVEE